MALAPQRGRSSMVERELPKLYTRVRFPSPAPEPFLEYLNLLNPKGYGLRPSGSFTHCNQHCN